MVLFVKSGLFVTRLSAVVTGTLPGVVRVLLVLSGGAEVESCIKMTKYVVTPPTI